MRNNKSIRQHPLFQGEETLDFGEIDASELSSTQRRDLFTSKYLEHVRPFSKFPKYFPKDDVDFTNRIIKSIKNQYMRFVIGEKWSEKKYILAINEVFETRTIFSGVSIAAAGEAYERGRLASQRRNKRRNGGRRA